MMNRRSFFSRTLGAIAAAACAPLVKFVTPAKPITLFDGPITFNGIPLVYSQYCPPNTIYFLNPKGLVTRNLDGSQEWSRPFEGYDDKLIAVKSAH